MCTTRTEGKRTLLLQASFQDTYACPDKIIPVKQAMPPSSLFFWNNLKRAYYIHVHAACHPLLIAASLNTSKPN